MSLLDGSAPESCPWLAHMVLSLERHHSVLGVLQRSQKIPIAHENLMQISLTSGPFCSFIKSLDFSVEHNMGLLGHCRPAIP